jgi:hypothetical protein
LSWSSLINRSFTRWLSYEWIGRFYSTWLLDLTFLLLGFLHCALRLSCQLGCVISTLNRNFTFTAADDVLLFGPHEKGCKQGIGHEVPPILAVISRCSTNAIHSAMLRQRICPKLTNEEAQYGDTALQILHSITCRQSTHPAWPSRHKSSQ